MFDIGFSEVLVISVIALVVVGPEKLPEMVRTGLMYVRKIKAGFHAVREEVERELDIENIKKEFSEENLTVDELLGYDDLDDSVRSIKNDIDESLDEIYEFDEDPLKGDKDKLHYDDILAHHDPDEHADTGVEKTIEKPTEESSEKS